MNIFQEIGLTDAQIIPFEPAFNSSIQKYQETIVGHSIFGETDEQLANLVRENLSNDFYQGLTPTQSSSTLVVNVPFRINYDGVDKVKEAMNSQLNQNGNFIQFFNNTQQKAEVAWLGSFYEISLVVRQT